jgi:trigger factor
MKITQTNTDDLNATIALTIEKTDYEPRVKKSLNEYRRKADIKGFRQGMAPMSLIEKMHGKAALLDEVQKIMSESLNKHIEDNNLHLLGEPLPNEDDYKHVNWNNPGDMDFKFDIAIAPEINIKFTEKDKVPFYEITVTDEDLQKYTETILRQYGTLVDVDAAEEDDFLKATLVQDEYSIEDAYISLKTIEDKKLRKPFIGKKAGDELEVDVKNTFTNETDLAAMLKVKKEALEDFDPVFKFKITEVKRFQPAEMNQDLFDRIFGKDEVKSVDDFNKKAKERIRSEYAQESDYRFAIDVRKKAMEKAKIQLPEEFLKRWLLYANEGKLTKEQVDDGFDDFADDLRWQMIRSHITKEQGLKVDKNDMLDHAKKMARYQFAMYGLNNVPESHIEQYAASILANEQEVNRIYEKVGEDKVIAYLKRVVKLDVKNSTMEKMEKLYEKK